jgi:hypothetical protein
MTYYIWGLPTRPIDTMVAIDDRVEPFQKMFNEVTIAAEAELPDVNPWERHFRVILCRGAKADLHEKWTHFRRW